MAWDVSGSMREHESQFFALVYALASVSRRARVFAFSTELTEVTAEVRRHRYRRAAVHTSARIALANGGPGSADLYRSCSTGPRRCCAAGRPSSS